MAVNCYLMVNDVSNLICINALTVRKIVITVETNQAITAIQIPAVGVTTFAVLMAINSSHSLVQTEDCLTASNVSIPVSIGVQQHHQICRIIPTGRWRRMLLYLNSNQRRIL